MVDKFSTSSLISTIIDFVASIKEPFNSDTCLFLDLTSNSFFPLASLSPLVCTISAWFKVLLDFQVRVGGGGGGEDAVAGVEVATRLLYRGLNLRKYLPYRGLDFRECLLRSY